MKQFLTKIKDKTLSYGKDLYVKYPEKVLGIGFSLVLFIVVMLIFLAGKYLG